MADMADGYFPVTMAKVKGQGLGRFKTCSICTPSQFFFRGCGWGGGGRARPELVKYIYMYYIFCIQANLQIFGNTSPPRVEVLVY